MLFEALSIASTALGAINSYGQASASAAYTKKQAKWNDKMNAQRAKIQGIAVDTNVLRARTEATAALEGIQSSANEAVSQARVAAAANNVGAGSYDTVLNSFARKENQAEGNTISQLVAELVGAKLQREQIAMAATAGQSVDTSAKPSAFGYAASAAADYFKSTYGLKNAFSFGGGDSGTAFPVTLSGGPGISLSGFDPFAGIGKI